MSDHFQKIYRNRADAYDRLVAREDQHGNLFRALNDIRRLDGLGVVEFGAGTGRLTRMLAPQARFVHAFDIEFAMLRIATANMRETGMTNWSLALGDNQRMPVAENSADLAVEGWSFAHVRRWRPDQWQEGVDAMLSEMQRIVKPGGTLILIETMGTGTRRPEAPTIELAQLYEYWQSAHNLSYRWIRTDYQFASLNEADTLLREFFGDELTDQALARGKTIVPECTGVWWKHID